MLQCKSTSTSHNQEEDRCLKYTHLTFHKLFTTEAAIFILVPWWNGGIANSEEVTPRLGHRLVACLENP